MSTLDDRARLAQAQTDWDWARRMDPTTFALAYVVLLILVPSTQTVGALRGAGQPAVILGAAMFVLWLFLRATGSPYVARSISGLHVAWLGLVMATTASYVAATARAIGTSEMNAADRGMVFLVSWSGVFLLIADGTLTRSRLEQLLRVLASALVLAAAVGMSQYLVGRNWYVNWNFPILSPSWELGLLERAGFLRITGTTVHAIEYGIVQTMGIALVLHWALFARNRWARIWWWSGVALIVVTLPLTVARAPVVGLLVVVVMLVPAWPARWRWRALLAAPFAIMGIRAAFPGVIETIYLLFSWIRTDSSTIGRTEDYESMLALVSERPWLGRGVNTLIPDVYLTLDNAYLYALVTLGAIGLLATVGFIGTAIYFGFKARSRLEDLESKDLVHSLTTGLVVAAVGFGIFDGFGFPQTAGTFVILTGSVAAVWRLANDVDASVGCDPLGVAHGAEGLPRLVPFLTAMAFVLAVLTFGLTREASAEYEYVAEASLLVHSEDTQDGLFTADMIRVSSFITSYMRSGTAKGLVLADGGLGRYEIAQGDGSLARVTDRNGYGPIVRIRAVSKVPEETMATIGAVERVLKGRLRAIQEGVPPGDVVVTSDIVKPVSAELVHGAPSRSMLGLAVLSLLVGIAAYLLTSALTGGGRSSEGRGPRTP